jgi:hypothetical protein
MFKQNIDRNLGLYIGWCNHHNWIEAEYWVTEDNEYALKDLKDYEEYQWSGDCNSSDTDEKVDDLYCPLCGEMVSILRAVSLDSINKWDAYTFECPSHGVFKMKVECYSVWCEKDKEEVEPLYTISQKW